MWIEDSLNQSAPRGNGDPRTPETRVFVVVDDALDRQRLAELIEAKGWPVETFASASDYLAREAPAGPACLVLDAQLPRFDGLALQGRLVEMDRSEAIVFITADRNLRPGILAMKMGAVDFLLKPIADRELLGAIGKALARSAAGSQGCAEVARARAGLEALTPREFEVFRCVIAGLLNKQIADELHAAVRTIKRHRGCVMQKLGVVSVAELVWLAQRAGIAPPRLEVSANGRAAK
jgi:FixJ family two-component response regulator